MIARNDGFQLVSQIRQAVGGSGSAASFAQERINRLYRWIGDADTWQSWTPTFTSGASAGDGSFDGSKAVLIGTTCHFRMVFTLGSTSTVTGDVQVSTPYTMADSRDADGFRGTLLNTGVAIFLGVGQALSTSGFRVRAVDPSGTFSDPAALSSTIPFTWGNTDRMLITGTYEIAR